MMLHIFVVLLTYFSSNSGVPNICSDSYMQNLQECVQSVREIYAQIAAENSTFKQMPLICQGVTILNDCKAKDFFDCLGHTWLRLNHRLLTEYCKINAQNRAEMLDCLLKNEDKKTTCYLKSRNCEDIAPFEDCSLKEFVENCPTHKEAYQKFIHNYSCENQTSCNFCNS